MNSPLLTEAAKGAESSRINLLNNTLVNHAASGLEAHDTEGVVAYTFTDSGGNSLSPYSLLIGGVQTTPVKIYIPLAQNPQPFPVVSGLFEFTFTGIKFVNEDDLDKALAYVSAQVQANASLTTGEKQAITGVLSSLVYESQSTEFSPTVNGTQYVFTVNITTPTGYIKVSYQR